MSGDHLDLHVLTLSFPTRRSSDLAASRYTWRLVRHPPHCVDCVAVSPHGGGLNMRFSRLSLERYGRFEDCELDFRPGSPDLHVIYGENEAGKTTSLAAVSDLLFGFPVRSPYNFLFDYSLIRVGAVLEDGGTTLACRRKKGTSGTLLDAEDVAIHKAKSAERRGGKED